PLACPGSTVSCRPDVIAAIGLRAVEVLDEAAEHPQAILEHRCARGEARAPAAIGFDSIPGRSVARCPDLVGCFGAWKAAVVPAAHKPDAIAEDGRHREIGGTPGRLLGDASPLGAVR